MRSGQSLAFNNWFPNWRFSDKGLGVEVPITGASTTNRIRLVICGIENDMELLKQSTAATTIVGPILDSTGAAYTGAVIGDLNITKNGTTAAMAAAATLTHDHNGHYLLLFTTGNTDTLGRVDITCNKATYAMPQKSFTVLTSAEFDILITNGTIASATNITAATGITVATNNDKTGYSLSVTPPTSAAIATAVWTDTTAGDFTVALSIGKSVMNGVSLGTGLTIVSVSGAVGSIATGGIAAASFAAGAINASAIADGAIDGPTFASGALDAVWSTAIRALTDKAGFTVSGTITTLDALNTSLSSVHGAGGWATATGFAVAGDSMSLTASERNSTADAILTRDVSNVEGVANDHSLCYVVLASSEVSISGTTMTVKKTDGSTTFATKTVSKTASDDPIRGIA